jgi:periplasmic protein CpxP/Spy
MSWFRSAMCLSAVLVIANGAIIESVRAQQKLNFGGPVPGPVAKNSEQIVKELNLTPRQVQQLKAMRQKFQGRKQEQKKLLEAAKQELDEMLVRNAPSAKIRDQRNRLKTLQQQFSDLKFDNMMALKEILTAEQWAKLQKMKQQRVKSMSGKS